MMSKKIPKTPALRHHKASGRAFIELDKRRIYLGPWGTIEATTAYHRIVAEWATNGYQLPVPPEEITIAEMLDAYMDYAEGYYCDAAGFPTSSMTECRTCARDMLTLYHDIPASQFGPLALRTVRQVWVDRGLTVTTINSYTCRIRAIFKWATSHQMIPPETLTALQSVSGLRRGRGVGRDTKPRTVVPMADIEAVIEHMPSPLRAIIRLLLLTGARPSEILRLKRGDIDCTGEVWAAVIRDHKLAYRGTQRTLYFGPRAQAVLRPFLLRADDAYLFSPIEAEAERHAACKTHRRDDQKTNAKKTPRIIGYFYDASSLARAITRVCQEHDIPRWTAYQLRHTAATTIEATADMETAKAILGHTTLNTTLIYTHRDNKTATAYAAIHG